MADYNVGAGILSIITESLYDNPIVVFREYVQNSVDSIFRTLDYKTKCEIKIWSSDNNLFFLDNGNGISKDNFESEMVKIGASSKRKQKNLGYKGIGRLSGVPYCKELLFINIYDYAKGLIQVYTIDGDVYERTKLEDNYSSLSFEELMSKIGKYENLLISQSEFISSVLLQYDDFLKRTNTGFLVVLKNMTAVLNNTMEDKNFLTNLKWLLPIDFDSDLYDSDKRQLFEDLTDNSTSTIPIKHCRIFYNNIQLFRPIKREMLRDYVCKSNFKYAVGFHTFKGDKIYIDKNNEFTGIRIYIDNMLLCDENELLQSLDHYGLLSHTINGQLQSVRGIGAMIYITDKVNICANARRTFIEVTDNDSLEFLRLLAEFVNTIYDTRYALSNYVSFKEKQIKDSEKLKALKSNALENLRKLAKENVELTVDEEIVFIEDMGEADKKREIKKRIVSQFEGKLKEYLKQMNDYKPDTAFDDFLIWLQKK